MVTENTTWIILRACIVWNIWVQKCAQELNGEAFSIGKVLYHAWKTTIQMGMEVWAEICRHTRSKRASPKGKMIAALESVWTKQRVFADIAHVPKWKVTPRQFFLPYNLAKVIIEDLEPPQPDQDFQNAASPATIDSEDLSTAIKDMFAEVNQELQKRTVAPIDEQMSTPTAPAEPERPPTTHIPHLAGTQYPNNNQPLPPTTVELTLRQYRGAYTKASPAMTEQQQNKLDKEMIQNRLADYPKIRSIEQILQERPLEKRG
ncbi:hypothetical protein M758_UG292100 [Ceratodon purpureus]|nr:hypothetical protein M758_UG292100 [Ceratodon purpureus]